MGDGLALKRPPMDTVVGVRRRVTAPTIRAAPSCVGQILRLAAGIGETRLHGTSLVVRLSIVLCYRRAKRHVAWVVLRRKDSLGLVGAESLSLHYS